MQKICRKAGARFGSQYDLVAQKIYRKLAPEDPYAFVSDDEGSDLGSIIFSIAPKGLMEGIDCLRRSPWTEQPDQAELTPSQTAILDLVTRSAKHLKAAGFTTEMVWCESGLWTDDPQHATKRVLSGEKIRIPLLKIFPKHEAPIPTTDPYSPF